MLTNRRTLRIEWGQCDPAGIVFYPQYLIIFDTSTGCLFERTGLSPSAMRKKYGIVGMPIIEVGARFVQPCRFDDEVVVESEVGEWGRSSFTVRHRILKAGESRCRRIREAGLGEAASRAARRDQSASGPGRNHRKPFGCDRQNTRGARRINQLI
jgi:4-hydroxybenzoyl-CoA thioesterase